MYRLDTRQLLGSENNETMSAESRRAQCCRGLRAVFGVRSWRLWRVPGRALAVILLVDFLTVITVVAALATARVDGAAMGRWVLMAALSVVYAEAAARLERLRAYMASAALVNMTSVWSISAVLLLPPGYAATLIAFLFIMSALRGGAQKGLRPHRLFFTTCASILAALAAQGTADSVQPHLSQLPPNQVTALAILAALATFFLINTVLILVTIFLVVGPVPIAELLPERDELGLEFATLVLGVLTAETVLWLPWLSPGALVLMLVMQRSSLVSQLEVAATTDSKTGLLNATAWQELAQRELLRAQRDESPCAVLLLDLDYFKRVNDTLGHLAGDTALKAVGDALKKELRGYDAVARFGGEEFVVFLNDLGVEDALMVADRTLARIRSLVITSKREDGITCSLTASIGLAAYPQHGAELTDLIEAADGALYTAKNSGRDRVCVTSYPEAVNRQG
jgi:diguanylate cyclase (GGDEF)-like protein